MGQNKTQMLRSAGWFALVGLVVFWGNVIISIFTPLGTSSYFWSRIFMLILSLCLLIIVFAYHLIYRPKMPNLSVVALALGGGATGMAAIVEILAMFNVLVPAMRLQLSNISFLLVAIWLILAGILTLSTHILPRLLGWLAILGGLTSGSYLMIAMLTGNPESGFVIAAAYMIIYSVWIGWLGKFLLSDDQPYVVKTTQ